MPNRVSSPYREAGAAGTAIIGGYVIAKERNAKMTGDARYINASDILANASIVAASVRYFLNLCSAPVWKAKPPNDTDRAKEAAEFAEEVINSCSTNWSRIVRRAGMFRFHGFGIHEWTAIKRADGRIGFSDVEQRPQHTIKRWQVDEQGTVEGVWQRAPLTGEELWLPRKKIVYLVDDMMTDSPEGLGWYRHLVEPWDRLKEYLKLEQIAYQRDLAGTPIGRVPIEELRKSVAAGVITKAEMEGMVSEMEHMVTMQVKEPNTGLVLDSMPYTDATDTGMRTTAVRRWDMELLQGQPSNIAELGKAVERLAWEMARIIGTENILTGSNGVGSQALSSDKSRNLYLTANATNRDMAEAFTRDLIDPLWMLNGLPDEDMPELTVEDVSFKDVEQMARTLKDMSTAGATFAPDDDIWNELLDLMGLPAMAELSDEERAMAMGMMPKPGVLDPNLEARMAQEEARAAAEMQAPAAPRGRTPATAAPKQKAPAR